MADLSYDAYQKWLNDPAFAGILIKPSFEDWQASQGGAGRNVAAAPGEGAAIPSASGESLYNADGSSKNGAVGPQQRNADGGVSPASFEDRLAAGEFSGNEANATQLEARRRRNLLTQNHDMKALPPDVADLVNRDSSGKVRRARSSTTQSALGAAFNVKSSMFGER